MTEAKPSYVTIDQTKFEVRNTDVPVSHVDVFTEGRMHNGTIALSLGAISVDGIGNEPAINLVCRLRMNPVTAQILHAELGRLIEASLAVPDKSAAN